MSNRNWLGCVACWAAVVCVGSISTAQDSSTETELARKARLLLAAGTSAERPIGRYWIGVACAEVPGVLRAHIELAADEGLLISHVVADSPAERAGIVVHDVLLEANGKRLKSIEDLIKAVADAGDDEIELTWFHKGEQQRKPIKPALRRESAQEHNRGPFESRYFKWQRQGDGGPFYMRFLGPAFEMPHAIGQEFPYDLKIEVEKDGSKPAEITVKKGDKTWEISEEELDQLPPDVRPFVQRFTGWDFTKRLPRLKGLEKEPAFDMLFRVPPAPRSVWRSNDFEHQLEKRLDELNRRLDQMYHELRQLRGRQEDADDA